MYIMSVGERIPVSWYANSSALELSSIIEISTALFCSGAEQRCHMNIIMSLN